VRAQAAPDAWNCSICVRGLAHNWLDDIADFQHSSLSLAIFGALVEAQLRKVEGMASSNVTVLRRRKSLVPQIGAVPAWRPDVLGLFPGQP
jgi:hypothetical protein